MGLWGHMTGTLHTSRGRAGVRMESQGKSAPGKGRRVGLLASPPAEFPQRQAEVGVSSARSQQLL